MSAAVRYYSRSGNTKALAEAIARGAGAPAISIDAEDAALGSHVDVLFLGGALYAYGLDKRLSAWIGTLKKETVGKAVIFSSAALSRHALDLLRQALTAQGIPVEAETFFARSKPGEKQLRDAEAFGKRLR